MRILLLSLSLLLSSPGLAQAPETHWQIGAEAWSRPRDGQRILQMPPLRGAVEALLARPGSRLLIRYPGGEEGSLWAAEVKSWLVALGISSDRLELQPGSPGDDVVDLTLEEDNKT